MNFTSFFYRQGTYLVFALTFMAFVSHPAYAVLLGSAHDFTSYNWSNGEVCGVCHSPHGTPVVGTPLWNHEISTATYILYSSPTMYATPEQPAPGSISRLCLSCHDGTVAIDSFGGDTGTTYIDDINLGAKLGTNLKNDHPVGTLWAHQEQQRQCTKCHDLFNNMEVTVVKFYERKIECGSCHEVHNNVTNPNMLRVPMAASELCLICHGK